MTTQSPDATEQVTLAECPIGLFWKGDELCLKTEYGNNEGRIDAYIVSSGEFFWGDQPQSIANQRKNMVTPIDTDDAFRALALPSNATTNASLVEARDEVEQVRNYIGRLRGCRASLQMAIDTTQGSRVTIHRTRAKQIAATIDSLLATLRASNPDEEGKHG